MDNNIFDKGAFYMQDDSDNDDNILTMAFVNMQPLDEVYESSEAFKKGTLYPNLYKPFLGGVSK